MASISISYSKARENWVRSDAEKAIQMLLNGDRGDCFTISPQALNPLLKAIESIGSWKSIAVLPYYSEDAGFKPRYMVVKLGQDEKVTGITTITDGPDKE